MRVKRPLFSTAQGVSRTPHSCGTAETLGRRSAGMLAAMLWSIAPVKAGDEGWSVMVTEEAWARALMIEGSAAPMRSVKSGGHALDTFFFSFYWNVQGAYYVRIYENDGSLRGIM